MDKKAVAKELWLNYFNRVLFEKGKISEKEMRMMSNLIRKQCHNSYHGK